MVRRVRSKSGISGMDDVEGTAGWRMERERGRRGLFSGSNSNLMGAQMNGNEGAGGGGVGILQLLAPSQSKLVPILGQHTGWEDGYDKRQECAKVLGLESGWISILGRCVFCLYFISSFVLKNFREMMKRE